MLHPGRILALLTAALLALGAPLAAPAPSAQASPAACCCGTHGACLCSRLPTGRGCRTGVCRLQRPASGDDEHPNTLPPSPRLTAVAVERSHDADPAARTLPARFPCPDAPPDPPEPPPPRG